MLNRDSIAPKEATSIEKQNAASTNTAGNSGDRSKLVALNQLKWARVFALTAVVLLVVGIGTLLLAIQMLSHNAADCLQYQAKEFELCQHTTSLVQQLAPVVLVVAFVILALCSATLIRAIYLFNMHHKSS